MRVWFCSMYEHLSEHVVVHEDVLWLILACWWYFCSVFMRSGSWRWNVQVLRISFPFEPQGYKHWQAPRTFWGHSELEISSRGGVRMSTYLLVISPVWDPIVHIWKPKRVLTFWPSLVFCLKSVSIWNFMQSIPSCCSCSTLKVINALLSGHGKWVGRRSNSKAPIITCTWRTPWRPKWRYLFWRFVRTVLGMCWATLLELLRSLWVAEIYWCSELVCERMICEYLSI